MSLIWAFRGPEQGLPTRKLAPGAMSGYNTAAMIDSSGGYDRTVM